MSNQEIFFCILFIPAAYVIVYTAGKNDFLGALAEKFARYAESIGKEPQNCEIHGVWIEETVGCGDPFDPYKESYQDVWRCSVCGQFTDAPRPTKYFPHCGAKMGASKTLNT